MTLIFFSILWTGFIFSPLQFNVFATHNLSQNYGTLYLKFSKNLSLNTDSDDVSDKFLSFGLDSSSLRDMNKLPINDPKFINLVRHLSPAYLRVGGTDADCLYFKETEIKTANKQDCNVSSLDAQGRSNFTLSSADFLSLYEFAKKSGARMIFDLNTLLRNVDGSWNSDNAKEIIIFAKRHKMEIDWQMGNEPNSFPHVFNVSIPAEQLGEDYCKLREILDESGYEGSILVGPEANRIGDERNESTTYVRNFLENAKDCIDYVTWHQYYLDGQTATVQDFINATVFNELPAEIKLMQEALHSIGHNFPMWLSETSSAYGGGASNLSDRFVAGFLWLDKLGYSAKSGVQVVIRQSLYGGYYAMVGDDLNPRPDWWVSILYKKLISGKVLNLQTANNFGNVRIYAHCAIKQAFPNEDAAVVIYGVNLNEKPTRLQIRGIPKNAKIFSYFLTSDDLQSRTKFAQLSTLRRRDLGNENLTIQLGREFSLIKFKRGTNISVVHVFH